MTDNVKYEEEPSLSSSSSSSVSLPLPYVSFSANVSMCSAPLESANRDIFLSSFGSIKSVSPLHSPYLNKHLSAPNSVSEDFNSHHGGGGDEKEIIVDDKPSIPSFPMDGFEREKNDSDPGLGLKQKLKKKGLFPFNKSSQTGADGATELPNKDFKGTFSKKTSKQNLNEENKSACICSASCAGSCTIFADCSCSSMFFKSGKKPFFNLNGDSNAGINLAGSSNFVKTSCFQHNTFSSSKPHFKPHCGFSTSFSHKNFKKNQNQLCLPQNANSFPVVQSVASAESLPTTINLQNESNVEIGSKSYSTSLESSKKKLADNKSNSSIKPFIEFALPSDIVKDNSKEVVKLNKNEDNSSNNIIPNSSVKSSNSTEASISFDQASAEYSPFKRESFISGITDSELSSVRSIESARSDTYVDYENMFGFSEMFDHTELVDFSSLIGGNDVNKNNNNISNNKSIDVNVNKSIGGVQNINQEINNSNMAANKIQNTTPISQPKESMLNDVLESSAGDAIDLAAEKVSKVPFIKIVDTFFSIFTQTGQKLGAKKTDTSLPSSNPTLNQIGNTIDSKNNEINRCIPVLLGISSTEVSKGVRPKSTTLLMPRPVSLSTLPTNATNATNATNSSPHIVSLKSRMSGVQRDTNTTLQDNPLEKTDDGINSNTNKDSSNLNSVNIDNLPIDEDIKDMTELVVGDKNKVSKANIRKAAIIVVAIKLIAGALAGLLVYLFKLYSTKK